jgi:hypothetical protein
MPLHFLDGTISAVTLFGQGPLTLTPKITAYQGETLYVTDAGLSGTTLTVTITETDPAIYPTAKPAIPVFPAGAFDTAIAIVQIAGTTSTSTATSQKIVYTGNPLILTATVTPTPAGKYAGTDVTLAVGEWEAVRRGVEYVIVQQSITVSGLHEMRWFATSVDVPQIATPSTAELIPKPTGGGIQGPFGLEGG